MHKPIPAPAAAGEPTSPCRRSNGAAPAMGPIVTMRRLMLAALLALPGVGLRAAEQPIALATPTGTLQGTLATPDAPGTVPVVLIVAGSGPTDRDGNSAMVPGRNDSLRLLAQALSQAGFASVRFDKRGIAASTGAGHAEADLRLEDFVDDAARWVETLDRDPRFRGVAILGHSEGALIGLLAARRSSARAFVSVAGPADRASAGLRRQLAGRLPQALAARNEAILAALDAGQRVDDVPAALMALYRPSVQPYLISWLRYSPADELARLTIPCLVVQGDTDIQVEVADARALQAARRDCSLQIVPGMNHVLKPVPADEARQLASYADPTLPLAPEFVRGLAQFLGAALAGLPAARP